MDIRSIVTIEVKKEDYKFVYSMPAGSSYKMAHEAAIEIVHGIKSMAEEAEKKLKAEKPDNSEKVEVKSEDK